MGIFDSAVSASQAAGQLITQYTARVSSAATPPSPSGGIGSGGGEPERIQRTLVNLTLPPPVVEWLTPPLDALGLRLGQENIEGEFGAHGRSFNVIESPGGQRRIIFHIPGEVLEDGAGWDQVKLIPGDFTSMRCEPQQPLLVFSEGLNATHVAYALMVEPHWESQYGLKMCFVPWRHLDELKGKKEAELKRYLPTLLKVTDFQASSTPTASIAEISSEDVDALVQVLSSFETFIDSGATAWRLFFEQSGMDVLVGQIKLDDPVEAVAKNLVDRLKWQKPFPRYPTLDAMAVLVIGVWTREDLNEFHRKRIQKIIDAYNVPVARQR